MSEEPTTREERIRFFKNAEKQALESGFHKKTSGNKVREDRFPIQDDDDETWLPVVILKHKNFH